MFEVVAKSFKANVAINCDFISFSHINAMLLMDQKKTGNSPLSTTATYTGIFEEIRGLYAQESKAKELSLKKADFSFNSKKHTCKACKGMGKTKVSLDFLSDVWVNCDSCGGKRYDNTILGITFKGNSIAQLLDKSISQIKELFKEHASIHHQLQVLEDVGIGYLSLGQSTSSLSGGETQRLKLAKELMKNSPEKTLYIFDEPSIGLHFQDLEKLIAVFKKLAQAGHSVVLIEHHLQLIQNSDYLIDLGPHGGEKGGEVLFQGKTEDIKQCSNSYTAKALRGS
ncbi:MAG: hypothetical protein B7C24_00160 [Bacteroidetes bacterium 4572_77]|nr:MAG: hypothetical protein B7C24_00160 [Bacteroidetes bacterium 4572_77]